MDGFVRGLRAISTVDEILHYVLRQSTRLLSAQRAMFGICDNDGQIRMGVRHNMPDDGRGRPFSGALVRRALAERRVIVVHDTMSSVYGKRDSVKNNNIGCMMAAPIISLDEDVLGVLYVDHTGGRCVQDDSEQQDLLEHIANITALALRSAQAVEERKYRDRLMAAYAHNVRGALQVIRTNAEFLKPAHTVDRLAREAVDSIKAMSDGLSALSSAAVELHRLETYGVQTVEMDPILEVQERTHFLDTFARAVTGHSIFVEAKDVPMLQTDRTRFGMIIDELALNAVKYAKPQSQVMVDVRRGPRPSLPAPDSVAPLHRLPRLRPKPGTPFVRITVINRNKKGPIPPEWLGRLFEPFEQHTDQPWANYSSGLGLSVVREFVASLGGTVGVTSDDEHTTFYIDLPADTEPEGFAQPKGEDGPSPEPAPPGK